MRNKEGVFGRLNGESDILYIGSSKSSLRQRLRFYFNPGPSQHTNIRINKMLNKYSIDVAVATNSNPVELESKLLIEYYIDHDEQPPFNFQGPQSQGKPRSPPGTIAPVSGKPPRVTLTSTIENYLTENPCRCDDCITQELKLSRRQIANQYCRKLEANGQLTRTNSNCTRCGKHKIVNNLNETY